MHTHGVQAYELRGAGAVLHSHSLNAVLASLLDESSPTFSVTHLEMIKVLLLPLAHAQLCWREPYMSMASSQHQNVIDIMTTPH